MRTFLYSLTIHFLLTEVLRHVIPVGLTLQCLRTHPQLPFLGFHLSSMLPINRSIIQGSGIGPTLFIMFAYDLRPLDILNFLTKYADNATLLSPQNSKTSVELEMAHIINWATKNKMTLNLFKTAEIVFYRPNISHDLLPPIMHSVSRVAVAKLYNKLSLL